MGTFIKQLFATIAGIILSLLIFIAAIIALVVILAGDLFAPPTVTLERGTLLEISMNDRVVDAPIISPFGALDILSLNAPPTISMLDISLALEQAAIDPNITAISLRMDGTESLSLAAAAEIRELLADFKSISGKPIYAYAESYEQSEYLLATVADALYINPLGAITWQGVATNSLFFGDLLNELNIKAEVFRPTSCRYKSAVEPYTSNQMSEQSREQNLRIVNSLWSSILEQVSAARGVTTESLRDIARDQILVEADNALAAKMVDGVCYRDQYDDKMEDLGVVEGKSDAPRTISLSSYTSITKQRIEESKLSLGGKDNKIAVIYADGAIVDGDLPSATQEEVVSGVVARQLRRARTDDDVRAVILRVNSPGGSALAADVIWREMSLVREQKPLIVSFGAYAASGGYYISAPADIILTSRYTLTGSIGVFGVMFAAEEALRSKLKISMDGVVSSPSADFGHSLREATPIERAAMMRGVDDVYTTFRNAVEQGRHLSAERVEGLAGGRVWSGAEAVANGLADGEGGIRKALLIAQERCGLSGNTIDIVEYKDEYEEWGAMLGELIWGNSASVLLDIKKLLAQHNGVMMLAHERVQF